MEGRYGGFSFKVVANRSANRCLCEGEESKAELRALEVGKGILVQNRNCDIDL